MTPIRLQQENLARSHICFETASSVFGCAVENFWLLTYNPKWQSFHKYVQTQELKKVMGWDFRFRGI